MQIQLAPQKQNLKHQIKYLFKPKIRRKSIREILIHYLKEIKALINMEIKITEMMLNSNKI